MIVKICGLRRQEDVDAAARGAHMCGFIFVPDSPRAVTVAEAAALESSHLLRVGVFVNATQDDMRDAVRLARLDAVQLHGTHSADCARYVRTLPATHRNSPLMCIRTVWPANYPNMDALESALGHWASSADMFLLDAGTQGGGTGRTLPWEQLRHLRSPLPWLLAGGLTADNARAALDACSPHGLDFNSGLETITGRKDTRKIAAALRAVQG